MTSPAQPRLTRSQQILLAEDDADLRKLIADLFRAKGFVVSECINGLELLAELGDLLDPSTPDQVDLIISDVRMPGVTGLEIIEVLRDKNKEVPVILVTAFGDHEVHEEAKRLGAIILDKPFEIDDLMTAVDQQLR